MDEPTREEIDGTSGVVLLEFGTDWCTCCRAIEPQVAEILKDFPSVRRLSVEDGKGRPLGRSFQVKLWPTFVVLSDGKVKKQLVRPAAGEVREALQEVVDEPQA